MGMTSVSLQFVGTCPLEIELLMMKVTDAAVTGCEIISSFTVI